MEKKDKRREIEELRMLEKERKSTRKWRLIKKEEKLKTKEGSKEEKNQQENEDWELRKIKAVQTEDMENNQWKWCAAEFFEKPNLFSCFSRRRNKRNSKENLYVSSTAVSRKNEELDKHSKDSKSTRKFRETTSR